MNQLATNTERLPMDQVGMSTGSTGAKIAPQNLGEVVKFAEVMCRADIALPQHLRGNAGACMAVAMQALEWQMSPFAVASKSYAVGGRIAYEAQLIAAVVNTRSGIKGRLRYSYEGEGQSLTCTVMGILDGDECVYTSPPMGSITTKNSPLWKSDPQQQLGYFAARSWARRHCPEVILGVYDRDEAEEFRGPDNARDVTPKASLSARLAQSNSATQQATDEREGFTASPAADERSDALTGEILPNTNSDDETPASSSDNAGNPPVDEAGADDTPPSDAPASNIPDDVRKHFIDFARKALTTATDAHLGVAQRIQAIDNMELDYRDVVPEAFWEQLGGLKIPAQYVISGDRTVDRARNYIANDLLECKLSDLGGVDG